MRLSAPGASPVECIASWPQAGVFASGHASGSIRVSRVAAGARGRRGVYEDVVECVGHTGGVARLLALPTLVHEGGRSPPPLSLVSVGRDNRVRLWDVAASAPLPTSPGGGGSSGGEASLPQRKSFFSPPAAFPAPSAPLASFVCELVGGPTAAPVTSAITFGVSFAIASAEHTVRVWRHNRRDAISGGFGSGSSRTLAPVAALPVGAAQSALAASPVGGTGTGGLLAGGGVDGGVTLWDLGAPTPGDAALRSIAGYASRVHSLLWLPPPDGRLVTCAVGRGEAIKFWDVRSGTCTGAYALDSRLLCSVLLPDGRLVSGHESGEVLLWDPRRGSRGVTLGWHTGAVTRAAVSSDGRPVTGCGHGGSLVRVWSLGAPAAAGASGALAGASAVSHPAAAGSSASLRVHCATLASPAGNACEALGDMARMGDRCMVYTASSTPAGDDAAVYVWPLPEELTESAPASKAAAVDAIVWPQLAALQAAAAAAPNRPTGAPTPAPAGGAAAAVAQAPSPTKQAPQQHVEVAAAATGTGGYVRAVSLNPFCVDHSGSVAVMAAAAPVAPAAPIATEAVAPEVASTDTAVPSNATAVAAATAAVVAAVEPTIHLRAGLTDVHGGESVAEAISAAEDMPAEQQARLPLPSHGTRVGGVPEPAASAAAESCRAQSPPVHAALAPSSPPGAAPSRHRSKSDSSFTSDSTSTSDSSGDVGAANSRSRSSYDASAGARGQAVAAIAAQAAAASEAAAHATHLNAASTRLAAAQAALAAAQAALQAAAVEVADAAAAVAAVARSVAA